MEINLIIGIKSISSGGKMGFYTLRFFIMSSDSAETSTNDGDLIVANKMRVSKLKENDVIIYKLNNRYVIKKIEKFEKEDNNRDISIYVKKSVKDSENDEYEKVDNKDIAGKELFKIKGVGNVALFIKSPMGALNLLVILLCTYIILKKIAEKNKEQESKNIK